MIEFVDILIVEFLEILFVVKFKKIFFKLVWVWCSLYKFKLVVIIVLEIFFFGFIFGWYFICILRWVLWFKLIFFIDWIFGILVNSFNLVFIFCIFFLIFILYFYLFDNLLFIFLGLFVVIILFWLIIVIWL